MGVLRKRLGLELVTVARAASRTNTEAHEAYLSGRYLVVQRTRATIEDAVGEFEKAVELDPDYALAYAELSIATLLLMRGNYGDLTDEDAIPRATAYARKATVRQHRPPPERYHSWPALWPVPVANSLPSVSRTGASCSTLCRLRLFPRSRCRRPTSLRNPRQ